MEEQLGAPMGKKVAPAQVLAALICGQHTDFVISLYSDNAFVAITQVGKLGTVIQVREEGTLESSSYSQQVLLGQRESNLITTYAAQIARFVLPLCKTPMILTLAMKGQEPKMAELEEILAVLAHRVKW